MVADGRLEQVASRPRMTLLLPLPLATMPPPPTIVARKFWSVLVLLVVFKFKSATPESLRSSFRREVSFFGPVGRMSHGLVDVM